MAEYIVEIGDEKGKSFKILIDNSGFWRTLDKGFICCNSGNCRADKLNSMNVFLYLATPLLDDKAMFRLTYFPYAWQFNSRTAGNGWIDQECVLALDPGEISWVIIEQRGWF